MPDVSIIIPVYNAEKYLEECLSSITAQKDFERSEVVLIDDGSTDRSSEICDSFSAEFKIFLKKGFSSSFFASSIRKFWHAGQSQGLYCSLRLWCNAPK